ncbi:MAG TPA: alpha/beta fold hydrolase [Anaerolineaceae bacterium]|nr:alpha/beta fold hydrolase [Anaerolineaceae bacterium]
MKEKRKKKRGFLPRGISGLVTAGVLTSAAWILYSRRYIDHHARVKGVLEAEQGSFEAPTAGKLHFTADTRSSGRPLVILHGIHAAAGSHDIAPIFNAFRSQRPVYALDLPGFGGSERSDRPYRPSMYQAALTEFIREQVGEPADVIAQGLSAEFAALAAQANPGLIRSLILLSPTGFEMPQVGSLSEKIGKANPADLLYTLLAVPLWSLPLFDILSSRPRLSLYYRQRFEADVPEELVSIAYASAHQPGAHFAPMVFASGRLSVRDVREKVYDTLTQAVLVVYDSEPGRSFAMLLPTARAHANWSVRRIRQSRGMPHFDRPGEFFHVLEDFLKAQDKRGAEENRG